jgi:hypothetical protein
MKPLFLFAALSLAGLAAFGADTSQRSVSPPSTVAPEIPEGHPGNPSLGAPATPAAVPGIVTWGTVDSFRNGRLTLRDDNGETNVFQVAPDTSWFGTSAARLRPGDMVTIQYGPDANVVHRLSAGKDTR